VSESRYAHRVVATIMESIGPIDRGAKYANPLDAVLKSAGLGEVLGGGSQLNASRGIAFADLEVALADLEGALELLRHTLAKLGAPAGSMLSFSRPGGPASVAIETGAPVADAQSAVDAMARRLIVPAAKAAAGAPVPYAPELVKKTAQKLLASYQSLFVEAFHYGPIDRAAYDADLFDWYDATGAEVQALGFTALADLKIVKDPSRPEPGAGPFARKFVSNDHVNRADIFQIRGAKGGPYTRAINIVAELDDGRFLWTSTAPQRWNTPDHAILEYCPAQMPVGGLHARHATRLAEHLRGHPGVAVVPLRTLAETLDSENRAQAAAAAFRRRQAVPTVDELLRMGSERQLAVLVHEELRGQTKGGDAGPAGKSPGGEWHVAEVELPVSGKTMSFDALIPFALDQGLRQLKEVGSPLNPFLLLDSGRAFFFVCTAGDADPMEIALQTLRERGAEASSCALVVDTRIALKNGTTCDAIVAMASRRDASEGQTWAQSYRPKGWFKSFKALEIREQVATSKSLFAATEPPGTKV
jgi:hypothetical protein